VLCTFLPSCRGDASPADGPRAASRSSIATTGTTTPLDAGTLVAAQDALRAFLDASRETQRNETALDSLGYCGEADQAYFPSTLLAGYTLLPFEARGDTVVGRAEVVTVAEQDVDRRASERFVARERIRRDVLEWDVIPVDADRWVVCNGLRFGYRGSDSLTTWRPEGASYANARRLADSIAAVDR
jgi:hypothetical protein